MEVLLYLRTLGQNLVKALRKNQLCLEKTSEVEIASDRKTATEIRDTPFRSSEMIELRHPAEIFNLRDPDLEDLLLLDSTLTKDVIREIKKDD